MLLFGSLSRHPGSTGRRARNRRVELPGYGGLGRNRAQGLNLSLRSLDLRLGCLSLCDKLLVLFAQFADFVPQAQQVLVVFAQPGHFIAGRFRAGAFCLLQLGAKLL